MKAAIRLLLFLALLAPSVVPIQAATTPVPTCKLYAGASTVGYNTRVRLDWTSTNTQSGYLTEVGAIGPKGYAFVVPGKNTTYAASFTGPGGSVVCRVAIVVSSSNPSGSGLGGSGEPQTNTPVNTTSSPLDTDSSVETQSGVGPGGSVDTSGSAIDTSSRIDTSGSAIDTNQPVNINSSVNFDSKVTLPTAQNILPTSGSSRGGLLSGIVPAECRSGPPGTDPLNTVKNCDMCALGQLVQNLINFLIGLTIPIAALLFAWAGILYFSSRGNITQIQQAHKVFRTVVIGFMIVIAAWTLVNTVMNMLVKGADFKGWSWSSLNCQETRKARIEQTKKTINEYINSSLPGLSSYTPPPSTVTGSANGTSCPDGGTVSVTENGNFCSGGSNGTYRAATLNCPAGYTAFFDSCQNSVTGDIVNPNSSSGIPYKEPTSYASCYESDYLQGEQCLDAFGGTYPPYANTYANAGPEGTCQSGYNYTEDAEYAWCQGPNGANDIQDFLPAGKGGGPLITCDTSDPNCGNIYAAASRYKNADTSGGPPATEAGNKACAWAVNNVLRDAGIAPIDGLAVSSMEGQLKDGGRGEFRGTATAAGVPGSQPGDIIVWKDDSRNVSHVGFCTNVGCTSTISNSSSGTFSNDKLGPVDRGVAGRVYKVVQ